MSSNTAFTSVGASAYSIGFGLLMVVLPACKIGLLACRNHSRGTLLPRVESVAVEHIKASLCPSASAKKFPGEKQGGHDHQQDGRDRCKRWVDLQQHVAPDPPRQSADRAASDEERHGQLVEGGD